MRILKWSSMKSGALALAVLMGLGTSVGSTSASAQTASASLRNPSVYNIQQGLGFKGFDPVSAFPEGGGVPVQGIAQFKLDYMGVTYMFASAANLDLFVQNPDRYEPTYGSWCAFAMASGTQVDIEPQYFTIHGNRAHYFVSARAKRNFDRDIAGFEARADKNWKQISGEEPRL
jgi:YHS domain-containing protein